MSSVVTPSEWEEKCRMYEEEMKNLKNELSVERKEHAQQITELKAKIQELQDVSSVPPPTAVGTPKVINP